MFATYHDYWNGIEKDVKAIEESGDLFLIDQVAYLLGIAQESFAKFDIEQAVKDCPKIQVLMTEIEPIAIEPLIGLSLMPFIDRDDLVGRIADRMRKAMFGR